MPEPPPTLDPKLAYRTAALKALATGGTAARGAFDQAAAALDASKTASIGQAMGAAAGRGATGPAQEALAGIIGAGANSIGAGLASKGAAVGQTFDTITPPWSKVFDSERALAQAQAGGRGGGGGGGGGGSASSKEPGTWDWFYDHNLDAEYGAPSSGGFDQWADEEIRGVTSTRGGQLGLAKQYGVPGGVRRGEFGDTPTVAQKIAQGLEYMKLPKSDPKYVSKAVFQKYLKGIKGHAGTVKKAQKKVR